MKAIDLGAGRTFGQGDYEWKRYDIRPMDGVDVVINIGTDTFPEENDSIYYIHAHHIFEHLYPEELFHCIDECFRVIHPLGHMEVEVPKAGTPAYYLHPDHKIQFVEDTFGFFQVPHEGYDPHGYLKGFWHISIIQQDNPHVVRVKMLPNKKGGMYPYVDIR